MKLTATNEGCRVTIDKGEVYGTRLTRFLLKVSGRKKFLKDGKTYWFETSQRNIENWLEIFEECEFEDERQKSRVLNLNNDFLMIDRKERPPFQTAMPGYNHQDRAFAMTKDLECSALFMETGTGKTKVTIDKAVYLWCKYEIDVLFVITKKGVHEQWVDEQIVEHIHSSIPYVGLAWEGGNTKRELEAIDRLTRVKDKLIVFSINMDAIWNKKGYAAFVKFLRAFQGRVYGVVDESQEAKDPETNRAQTLLKLKPFIAYRSILSGTPITKNLEDVWGQFFFLDADIIGEEYKSSFRKDYCRMGGFEGKKVMGHKNLEKFYQRIDKVTFRATKDELDLPEKVYERKAFKLTNEQRDAYEKLKEDFLYRLDQAEEIVTSEVTGEQYTVLNERVISVEHAATMILRLQQITCGFMKLDDGTTHEFTKNPRLELVEELDELIGFERKKIIWCRFQHDANVLMRKFGARAVDYIGPTPDDQRAINKRLFLDANSGKDILISNPAAGGTGLNLQGLCTHAIYYSNSFNAVHRWQSEDRIHRIGTKEACHFLDLIASRTVDTGILANLRQKKEFSTLVLDDIRKMLHEAGNATIF
jgi:SNF2 family DNA or RNA helicase